MTLYISHIEKVTLIMGSDQHDNMIKLMGKILITSTLHVYGIYWRASRKTVWYWLAGYSLHGKGEIARLDSR